MTSRKNSPDLQRNLSSFRRQPQICKSVYNIKHVKAEKAASDFTVNELN